MISIQSVDHILLRTNCLDKMVEFYCDILNGHVEMEQEEFSLTQIRLGENLIDLMEANFPIDAEKGNVAHFCLRVKNFNYDELASYFKEKQIEIYRYGKRYGSQGYGYSFYIQDPQGNEIELTEAK